MRFILTKILILFVLAGIVLSSSGQAESFLTTTRKIADLNPGISGSFPSNLTMLGDALYFGAHTEQTGRELWRYDGTSITLDADINDVVTNLVGFSSFPTGLVAYRNKLFFSAFDQRRGGELWSYDGTNAVRVADINPDANDNIKTTKLNNSWPSELMVFNDALYFSAASETSGNSESNYELRKYDGTNVTLVTNINPGTASSFPRGLTPFKNALYFMADDGAHGYELWKHTGSQTLLTDLNPGDANSSSFPKIFFEFNDVLYFQAFHSTSGFELWKTDGTSVSIAADINPGLGNSNPDFPIVYNGLLYFRADDGIHGSELWRTDGTNFTLAADINPGGSSFPKNFTLFNDHLFFAATDGANGWELWKYDGATAALVTNLNANADAFPESLTILNNRLYFVATTPETGYELWFYDGNFVTLAADIRPNVGSSFPHNLKVFNGQLVFSAEQAGSNDYELWAITTAPFRIESLHVAPNQAQLFWKTLGGTTNIVQASENLSGPYTNLSLPITISGTSATATNYIDEGNAIAPTRFYRVVQPVNQ